MLAHSTPVNLAQITRGRSISFRPKADLKIHPRTKIDEIRSSKDFRYILRVIDYLRHVRERKGLLLREVAALAELDRDFLLSAENHGLIPNSSEFKAWCAALDLSWEQVWTRSLAAPRPRHAEAGRSGTGFAMIAR